MQFQFRLVSYMRMYSTKKCGSVVHHLINSNMLRAQQKCNFKQICSDIWDSDLSIGGREVTQVRIRKK